MKIQTKLRNASRRPLLSVVPTMLMLVVSSSALALCGDSLLDLGEQCDDSNTASGDGCSSACLIEDGFFCTPPDIQNGVPEGSFESGTPNPIWAESSQSFGTPLCSVASCGGTGGGTGPNSGAWWVWFGGIVGPEAASIEQSLIFELADTELTFAVEQSLCDSTTDFARVLVDGDEVFNTNGDDPACGAIGYRTIAIDLTTAPGGGSYNDGLSHVLRIESGVFSVNSGISNFFFDDFLLERVQPSVCTALPPSCYLEDFDPAIDANFESIGWNTFLGTGDETGTVWGTTDDLVCGSGSGQPGNYTGGNGQAACIDTDVVGAGQTEAYLCSDAIDLSDVSGATLEFNYSYHYFDAGSDDIFNVLVGMSPPDPATVASFETVLATGGINQGELYDLPGVHEAINISSYDGQPAIYVCYQYGGDFDWYAQVDDVSITGTGPSCGAAPDTDEDGVADSIDNCTNVANPLQQDADGDGHGNICDGDFDNNCFTTFPDLSIMQAGFFSIDPVLDLNSSGGPVNFGDLAIMNGLFFLPPGPSAPGSLCNP